MRKIGRYEIKGLLGRGGMSTVYKVAMPVTGKIVALKLMSPPEILKEVMGLEELRRLFIAEAVTMARIRHPHIADVWDCDEHQGMPFFVMEFLCNNLGLFINEHFRSEEESRPLEEEKIFHYGSQVLDGLACLHQAGIIHRDIKPYNILLTDLDTVKIADFGMSKLHGEHFPNAGNLNVGSPFYAAPEQEADPDSVDGRADLYATGVMLFRMLFGVLPEPGLEQLPSPPAVLEREWTRFFQLALARKPEKRFATARKMQQALMELEQKWEQEKENVCQVFFYRATGKIHGPGPSNPAHRGVECPPGQGTTDL